MTPRKHTLLTTGAIGLLVMIALYVMSTALLLHRPAQLGKADPPGAGTAPVQETGDAPMQLLRAMPPDAPNQQGQTSVLYLLAGLVVIILLFGFVILLFLERSVLRPLSRLSHEVSQIRTEGDLSTRVSVTGQHELAELARAINGMIAALESSQQKLRQSEEQYKHKALQLEALRQVGLELTTQLELESLLRSIVARAIHMMGANDGGLYLYRPEQDALERVVSVGGTIPLGSTLYRGEGLSGKVWETGEALIVEDYQSWAGKAPVFQTEPSMAVIGVPVRWRDKFLGILNVAASPPHAFTTADAELLNLFATQAAAALENARLYSDLQQRVEQLRSTQAQLIRSARMVAVGELAAGIAHQLNNSLTPILGYTELMADSLDLDSPLRSDLERIATRARQAGEIVRNLLDFARQLKPQKQMTNINDILRKTLTLIRAHLEKADVAIEETYGTDLDLLPVDGGQIGQVFLNLINNAVQAMPKGGNLRLRTYSTAHGVAVAISDTGPGMSPDIQARLFEPFFTTRPERAGLGLAVSLGIVQEHGGRIDVESSPGQGSTFTVWLPPGEGPADLGGGALAD